MLEYASKNNKRKDYVDNLRRYERELKVPYYLLFDYEKQVVFLYHHNGKRYESIKPNADGRLPLPEVDLEMAILDGWVRFCYKGQLLPLPGHMQKELESLRDEIADLRKQLAQLQAKKNGRNGNS